MKIIQQHPNPSGGYPPIQSMDIDACPSGCAVIPDDLDTDVYYQYNGFVTLTVMDDVVVGMAPNLEAYEAWRASLPPEPNPMDAAREAKLAELSDACGAAITAGCDVTLAAVSGHISLTAEDQINLSTALAAVEQGAAGYPYHLDGQLCAVFPAADIRTMAEAATAHKLYHTTYYNHLAAWVRRCATLADVEAITYGADLPEDLADNMAAILAAAGGSANV